MNYAFDYKRSYPVDGPTCILMLTTTRWFWLTGEPSQEAIGMTPMTLSAFILQHAAFYGVNSLKLGCGGADLTSKYQVIQRW